MALLPRLRQGVVAFSIVLVGACGGASSDPLHPTDTDPGSEEDVIGESDEDVSTLVAPGESVAEVPPPPEATTLPPAGQPQITLLSPGAEPRTALRYTVKAKQTEKLDMTMKMRMHMSLDGRPLQSMALPPMATKMTLKVNSVQPDGTFEYTFKIREFKAMPSQGVPKKILGELSKRLGSMVGMSGTVRVTSRGFTEDMDVNIPTGMDREASEAVKAMASSMREIATPLPEEAVGVGARWEVVKRIELRGITLRQKELWTLENKTGSKFTTKVKVDQAAPPQRIELPGLPGNAKVNLLSLQSAGAGTTERDTGRIAPKRATSHVNSESRMAIKQGGRTVGMNMEFGLDTEVRGSR